jgi:hypothetical protein
MAVSHRSGSSYVLDTHQKYLAGFLTGHFLVSNQPQKINTISEEFGKASAFSPAATGPEHKSIGWNKTWQGRFGCCRHGRID